MTNAVMSKQIPNYETSKVILRDPGAGAIEFARQYLSEQMEYEQCLDTLIAVIDGYVEGVEDKRVKRCDWCGHLYKDSSPKNNRKTCSDECKAEKDYQAKKTKRKVVSIEEGTIRKYADDKYYQSHLEYPFWVDSGKMEEYHAKRGSITLGDKFEAVVAASQKREMLGGKRVNTDNVGLYEGEWSNKPYKPSKEFYGDTKPDASKVRVTKQSAEEIEQYMAQQFSDRKRREARRRAIEFERSRKKF